MNIIVTGGNFANKGAETMLLVTMAKLREKYPDAKLYYTSYEKYNPNIEEKYDFTYLYKFSFLHKLGEGSSITGLKRLKYQVIDFNRLIMRRNWKQIFCSNQHYEGIIGDTMLIVDVSGFTLSSKFSTANYIATDYYLDLIEGASARNIPIVLLPQSFGPFEYSDRAIDKIARIKAVLPMARIIFARERLGYDALINQMGLQNVVLSDDLVLQTKNIDTVPIERIRTAPNRYKPETNRNNVAIIPNARVKERFSDVKMFWRLYESAVKQLISLNKNVYLIWHSKEDKAICEEIKRRFEDNDKVRFVENELEFYEYEEFIVDFDYIIASRFHSIVHAYRHSLPCICLGWADKYKNLLDSCNQGEYLINVGDDDYLISMNNMIREMEKEYTREAEIIHKALNRIQDKNCFDIMFEEMEGEKLTGGHYLE